MKPTTFVAATYLSICCSIFCPAAFASFSFFLLLICFGQAVCWTMVPWCKLRHSRQHWQNNTPAEFTNGSGVIVILCFLYFITLVCENSKTSLFTASGSLYVLALDVFEPAGGSIFFFVLFCDHAFWCRVLVVDSCLC